jgi:hypothetical protein
MSQKLRNHRYEKFAQEIAAGAPPSSNKRGVIKEIQTVVARYAEQA